MVKRRRARFLSFGALALVAALVPAGLASGNPVLDGIGFLDCATEAATTPDADAAAALDAAGYDCTRLFNKPTIDNANPQQVGQLWYRFSETSPTVLKMRVLFFSGGNTGFAEAKVCLDDDGSPINNVASGAPAAPTCLGNEVQFTLNQSGNNGPTYNFSRSADGREEPAGKLELAVERLTEINESFGGVTVGGWNVNLGPNTDNMFTEVLPHFNLGGFSIVAYFQPLGKRILCGETITLTDGDITATFKLEGIEGKNNDDPDCFKEVETAIDGTERTVVFEPSGAGVATYTGTISAVNELLDMTPGSADLDSVGVFIDTTSPFDFSDGKPLEACVLEGGVYVPSNTADGWGYTRSEAVPVFIGDDGFVYGTETHDLCGTGDPGFGFR